MEFYVITLNLCEQGLNGSTDTLEKANKLQARVLRNSSEVERMQNGEPIVLMTVPQCSKCRHWASRFDSAKEHDQLKDARPSEIAGLQRALDGKSNDPQYTMWGQCELGDEYKARSLDVKEPSQSLAFAECYDNDTWARLRTHATFGCLQFDPKTS